MIEARFQLDYPGFALDVDLHLPAAGVTALFGDSGSGKTTLLRCIAGLERAPSGQLRVDGTIWQDAQTFLPTHQRPLGYVFQEASLFPHLTVRANLDYGRKRCERQSSPMDSAPIIELLGIGHLLDRKPERLSGGERQRVAIARALLTEPRLLLMDEPLAALDMTRKQEILPYLEQLHETLNIPVLYVSHSADEVARLADHIVVLKNGQAIADGPLADTLARIDLPVKLGGEASVLIEGIVESIDPEFHLMRVDFGEGSLWVRHDGALLGQRQRLCIFARDVSLALSKPCDTSFLNILPAVVCELVEEAHPAIVLVRLAVGQRFFLARLTRRSATTLNIRPGLPVWMQIKAVATVI